MIFLPSGPEMRIFTRAVAMPLWGLGAGLMAAVAVPAILPPTYQASASVIIMPASGGESTTIQALVPSVARLAESREVALQAAGALGVPVEQVAGHISGVAEPGILIVTV